MSSGTLNRGDLLRRLATTSGPGADVSMLGFRERPEPIPRQDAGATGKSAGGGSARRPEKTIRFLGEDPAPARYWRATRLELIESATTAWWQPTGQVVPKPERAAGALPIYRQLCDWQALVPRLRRALGEHGRDRAVDLDKTIDTLSRGEPLTEVARRRHSGWGPSIYVIQDRRYHLAPYAPDQAMIADRLQAIYPSYGIANGLCSEVDPRPVMEIGGKSPHLEVPAGARILLLTDLGCLQEGAEESTATWCELVREWLAIGCRITALLPCSVHEIAEDLFSDLHVIGWERVARRLSPEARAAAVERLLTLLAPVVRCGPGLLRELRLSLGDGEWPAGVESAVWQHEAVSGSIIAQALKPDYLPRYRGRFLALDESLQRRAKRAIEAWSRCLPYEFYLETVWRLADELPGLFRDGEIADAEQLLHHIVSRAPQGRQQPLSDNAYAWLGRMLERNGEEGRRDVALWRSLAAINRNWSAGTRVGVGAARRRFDLLQQGGELYAANSDPQGSFLGGIHSTDNLLQTAASGFWISGEPPPWAADWGRDEYGPWVEFDFQGATQRLRWIPAGRFLMGSPESELGRYEDEGPQHQVTLTQGYWLFDTAVNQALWTAVMGENRSRHKGQNLPVDSVSWHDARAFIARLNEALPGLVLDLPTEAQWEYACRAGTSTPFSTGDNLSTDQANYNGNYPHGDYPKGEYRGQTVPVRQFAANARGLYQMHGNLYEWCADGQRE